MIGRLLSNLTAPAADEPRTFDDLSPEEQADVLAEEKRARVKFHRDHVRNGPVRSRTISVGQQKRAAKRSQAAFERKINRRHRASWQTNQLKGAILLGQLQQAGVLPYASDYRPSDDQRVGATMWIAERYAARDEDGQPILAETDEDIQAWWAETVQAALADYEKLSGRRVRRTAPKGELEALQAAGARVDAGGQFGVEA